MWNVKYDTNEPKKKKNRRTNIENRFVVGGGGESRSKDWEFGVSRCKLVCIERVNNRSCCIVWGIIFNIL